MAELFWITQQVLVQFKSRQIIFFLSPFHTKKTTLLTSELEGATTKKGSVQPNSLIKVMDCYKLTSKIIME